MGKWLAPEAYTAPSVSGGRRGRDKTSVTSQRAAELNAAACECSNLMEWLVVDMRAVAATVFPAILSRGAAMRAMERIPALESLGVLARMNAISSAFAAEVKSITAPELHALASYAKSDVPRQWAAYSAQILATDDDTKLSWARKSAADSNMTVRECAWMAFRPQVSKDPSGLLRRLKPLARDQDANVRRFAVEVTRPRSVWGAHIPTFKSTPQRGETLLRVVAADESRYVRLAVGNWINDAAKSNPVWAQELFERWDDRGIPVAADVRRRGLRSIES